MKKIVFVNNKKMIKVPVDSSLSAVLIQCDQDVNRFEDSTAKLIDKHLGDDNTDFLRSDLLAEFYDRVKDALKERQDNSIGVVCTEMKIEEDKEIIPMSYMFRSENRLYDTLLYSI